VVSPIAIGHLPLHRSEKRRNQASQQTFKRESPKLREVRENWERDFAG
jgi:hypothetical protein